MTPRFFLLEPSLRKLGGHYHEYAVQILRAAEQAGYQPILVAHKKLSPHAPLPTTWQVHRVFPSIVGGIHRVPREIPANAGRNPGTWLRSLWNRSKSRLNEWRWLRNTSRVRGFARACHAVFTDQPPQAKDIVFCATTTDTELLGLIRYLRTQASSGTRWHLQFHFRMLVGRDPAFASQRLRIEKLRRKFAREVGSIPRHSLVFHATSETLARQYRRLGLMDIDVLPWPVDERLFRQDPPHAEIPTPHAISGEQDASRNLPKRILVAGAIRDEKGGIELRRLVRLLDAPFLRTGKAQLVLQASRSKHGREETSLRFPPHLAIARCKSIDDLARNDDSRKAHILLVPHPLDAVDYVSLIHAADIGLLPYDPNEYFARCSGVLVEFIAAGVPVLGSAGCWLGDVIEQINQIQFRTFPGQIEHKQDRFGCPLVRHQVRVTPAGCLLRIDRIDPSIRDIVIRCHGLGDAEVGTYVRLIVRFNDTQGNVRIWTWLACHFNENDAGPITPALRRECRASEFRDSLQRHFRGSPTDGPNISSIEIAIQHGFQPQTDMNLRIEVLGLDVEQSQTWSEASIGLTLASMAELPIHLEEMLNHHSGYLSAAKSHSIEWRKQHTAHAVLRKVVPAVTSLIP